MFAKHLVFNNIFFSVFLEISVKHYTSHTAEMDIMRTITVTRVSMTKRFIEIGQSNSVNDLTVSKTHIVKGDV